MAIGNLISGEFRQKVGGYVGSKWKGKAYFRAYTKPSDPKTEGQLKVRGNFGMLMGIGSAINAAILKPYTAKKFKDMSAINRFMKINKDFIDSDGTDASLISIFKGGALPPTAGSATADANAGTVGIKFTPATQLGTVSNYVGVGFAFNKTKNICVAGIVNSLTGGTEATLTINIPQTAGDEIVWGASTYVEATMDGVLSKQNSNSLAGSVTSA